MEQANSGYLIKLKPFFHLASVAAIVAAAFWLGDLARQNAEVREVVGRFGYLGVLIVAFISGINIAVPIPAVSFMPLFLESGLEFWVSIFFIVAGVTLGDGVAYLFGLAGRELGGEGLAKKLAKLDNLRRRHTWAPLLLVFVVAAFVPLPNEIIVIPLALIGYRWWQMAPFLLGGNAVFNILASLGILNLFEFIIK